MNTHYKRLLPFVAVVALACVGCEDTTDQRLNSYRGSTWELSIFTAKVNERVDQDYASLLVATERHDVAEIKRATENIGALEQYISRFEKQIGVCRQAIEELRFKRSRNEEQSRAIDDVELAERTLPKVKKRLAALKSAWSQYQEGKPLPTKI